MTPLKMIEEWRKGCTHTQCEPVLPICPECTIALIDAIEFKLNKQEALKKLKIECEFKLEAIKNGNYGLATLALGASCIAQYAQQVSAITHSIKPDPSKKQQDVNINFKNS